MLGGTLSKWVILPHTGLGVAELCTDSRPVTPFFFFLFSFASVEITKPQWKENWGSEVSSLQLENCESRILCLAGCGSCWVKRVREGLPLFNKGCKPLEGRQALFPLCAKFIQPLKFPDMNSFTGFLCWNFLGLFLTLDSCLPISV